MLNTNRNLTNSIKLPLKLDANENMLGAPELNHDHMQRLASLSNLYPDGNYSDLRYAISKKWAIKKSNIIVGAGSDGLIELIYNCLIDEGDIVLAPKHSFIMYKIRSMQKKAKYVELSTDHLAWDYEGVFSISSERKKVLVLVNPSNPLAKYCSKDEVRNIVNRVSDNHIIIIDEAYSELSEDGGYSIGLELAGCMDNVICLRTFSKAYGLASIRVGWAYTSSKLMKILNEQKARYAVPMISANIATAALEKNQFIRDTAIHCKKWGNRLVSAFAKMGIASRSEGVNFVYVELSNRNQKSQLVQFLIENGVYVSELKEYELPTSLRITIGNQAEMEFLLAILSNFSIRTDEVE